MLGKLFSKEIAAQAATIERLRAEVDDFSESYGYLQQQCSDLKDKAAAAESAMQKMQMALSPDGPRVMAAEAAKQISDIYAKGFDGVAERDKAVGQIVEASIRAALRGSSS